MIFFFHLFIFINSFQKYFYFRFNSRSLQKYQLKKIKNIAKTYEEFKSKYPAVTFYIDYSERCLLLKKKGIRCVPTSGSTSKIKWIPYTKEFLEELSSASHPWLCDLYLSYPRIMFGKHFWSMSWLPDDLRKEQSTNDLENFSWIEKIIMKKTMALTEDVARSETLNRAMITSAVQLINQNVSLISVWSPTFLIELLEIIFIHKDEIILNINEKWKIEVLISFNELSVDFCKKMWPNLGLISCWDTSTSQIFNSKLKDLFPNINFQGKGLWATEGVVTIPFQGKFVLSYLSHFYEFECIHTGNIYPSWQIEIGKEYIVIVTTANGFYRYRLNDIVRVNDFYHSVPVLEFLGRDKEIDLVGEKLSHIIFYELIMKVNKQYEINAHFFIALSHQHPHYQLVVEEKEDEFESREKLRWEAEQFIENELLSIFHYRLAREAGQLGAVKIVVTANAQELFMKYAQKNIKIKGNIKVEPVLIVDEKLECK